MLALLVSFSNLNEVKGEPSCLLDFPQEFGIGFTTEVSNNVLEALRKLIGHFVLGMVYEKWERVAFESMRAETDAWGW